MNASFSQLSDEELLRIDNICESFEDELRRLQSSSIERFLEASDADLQPHAFRELLAIEVEFRQRNGDRPSAADYHDRFASYAEVVDEVLESSLPEGPNAPSDTAHASRDPDLSTWATQDHDQDHAQSDNETPTVDAVQHESAASGQDGSSRAHCDVNSKTHDFNTIDFDTIDFDTVPETDDALVDGYGQFGDYKLLGKLAQGGMGIVYRARQVKANRVVALKMILKGTAASDGAVQRFLIEAEAAARLDHPNIVPIHDVGEVDGQHYFSMGFVDGKNLEGCVKDSPLAPRKAAEILKAASEAISYAHANDVVHRDLKPSNVLIDSTGQPRITDFGLAKSTTEESGLTVTGQILGTPAFMPPEQALGDIENIGPLADVYSLGATLYFALTGRPPFMSANIMDTLNHVIHMEPVPPSQFNPSIDRDLETICLKCLQKEPHRRYQSAQDLADDIGRYLQHEPILARPIGRLPRSWRWCKRNPLSAVLSAAVVIAMVSGTVVSTLFGIEAKQNAKEAEKSALTASLREVKAQQLLKQVQKQSAINRRRLYYAEMTACGMSAHNIGGVRMMQETLAKWHPDATPDLSGWEWQLFNAHANRAANDIQLGQQAFSVDWSPDGEQLAVGMSGDVLVIGVDGTHITLEGHNHHVRSVRWSPDGKQLASGSYDGTAIIWTNLGVEPVRKFIPCEKNVVRCVDWSHDGEVLAILHENGNLELWKPDGSEPTSIISGTGERVRFSPNKNLLAVGLDRHIQIWDVSDLSDPQVTQSLACDDPGVISVAWSPNSRALVSGHFDGTINLWDIGTGELLSSRTGHSASVFHLDWSKRSSKFVSASMDRTARVWDIIDEQFSDVLQGHTDSVFMAAFSPDMSVVASTGEDSTVKIWQLFDAAMRAAPPTHRYETPSEWSKWRVAWHPKLPFLATSNNTEFVLRDTVKLAPQLARNQAPFFYGANFCWNRDGRLAAFANHNLITIWDVEADRIETQLLPQGEDGTGYEVRRIQWDPRRDRLAITCQQGSDLEGATFLWDEQRKLARIMEFPGSPRDLSWGRHGKTLAVTCLYSLVFRWDEETGETTTLEVPSQREGVHTASWCPDDNRLAMGCADNNIYIYDWDSDETLILRGHTAPVWEVAWHPAEGRLASASEDGSVKLWDTNTGELVTTLSAGAQVRAVGWHPDGTGLAALNARGTLWVWNTTKNDGQWNVEPLSTKSLPIDRNIPIDFEAPVLPKPAKQPLVSLKWNTEDIDKAPKSELGESTLLTFQNKRNSDVKVYWIGYDGERILYHVLSPNEEVDQGTYAKATWFITDTNDKPLGYFVTVESDSKAVIPAN